jgi:hypothetical protein
MVTADLAPRHDSGGQDFEAGSQAAGAEVLEAALREQSDRAPAQGDAHIRTSSTPLTTAHAGVLRQPAGGTVRAA